MASKDMTAKQKEIVARKLGYDGPMQGFDEFLKSDPALSRKYGLVLDKYMSRGGAVKKYRLGGDATAAESRDEEGMLAELDRVGSGSTGLVSNTVGEDFGKAVKDTATTNTTTNTAATNTAATNTAATNTAATNTATTNTAATNTAATNTAATNTAATNTAATNTAATNTAATTTQSKITFNVSKSSSPQEKAAEYNRLLAAGFTDAQIKAAADSQIGASTAEEWNYLKGLSAGIKESTNTGSNASFIAGKSATVDASGKPASPTAPVITAKEITATKEQDVSAAGAPGTATTAKATTAGAAETVAAPEKLTAETIDATKTEAGVTKALKNVEAAKGEVSTKAQVTAEEMKPTSTALSGIKAAEGVAQKVQGAPTRKAEEGEMVEGPAVDMERVERELARTTAEEGKVTKEMTVQGQLDTMLANFDAGNPPPWAAASLRAATAQLAARGLGASSLAGQAIIQTAMEAALPIAAQDAAVFQQMEMQNLSNRQQTAVLLAQQRAAFLGQEFDQEFQTRVVNAAKVSDIANMNFNAETQIALENARLAQTMDLANLNNKQAVVMANAAQIANLEMANLNNRQQAAVLNAQAFLQMDLTNLSNEQQTAMFKAQSVVQSIFTDAAADNAAKQFNASSKMQTDQFFASLDTQVKQFNAAQTNAMEQFNVSQTNALAQFNAQQQNIRDQFNAENNRIISQSNAEWRRQLTLANTQAANEAARINAQNSLTVTQQEYANLWQGYRDDIEMAWKTADNALDRDNQIALQVISKEATIEAAELQADAIAKQALGGAVATILTKTSVGAALSDAAVKGINYLTGNTTGDFMTELKGILANPEGTLAGSDITQLDRDLEAWSKLSGKDTSGGVTINEEEIYSGG